MENIYYGKYFFSLSPVVALIGGTNLTDSKNIPIPILEVKIHPGYKSDKSYHDIAVISLERDANETPICMWGSYSLDEVNVTAIGYGHTRFGKTFFHIMENAGIEQSIV